MDKDNSISGEGNSLDFGSRIYNSRLGRWLSTDPLQQVYPHIAPYVFSINCPIKYVDPDGKAVINADKLRLLFWQKQLVHHSKDLMEMEKTFGATRKEIKSHFKSKGVKNWKRQYRNQWNALKDQREYVNIIQEKVDLYTEYSEKTEEYINGLKEDSPNFYNRMNNMTNEEGEIVDMYLGMEDLFDGDPEGEIGGYNATPDFVVGDDGVTRVYSAEFKKVNVIVVFIEVDEYDRNQFEDSEGVNIMYHEGGHFEVFARRAEEVKEYYELLKVENRSLNGGHNDDDITGHKAKKYEKYSDKDFKEEDSK